MRAAPSLFNKRCTLLGPVRLLRKFSLGGRSATVGFALTANRVCGISVDRCKRTIPGCRQAQRKRDSCVQRRVTDVPRTGGIARYTGLLYHRLGGTSSCYTTKSVTTCIRQIMGRVSTSRITGVRATLPTCTDGVRRGVGRLRTTCRRGAFCR